MRKLVKRTRAHLPCQCLCLFLFLLFSTWNRRTPFVFIIIFMICYFDTVDGTETTHFNFHFQAKEKGQMEERNSI